MGIQVSPQFPKLRPEITREVLIFKAPRNPKPEQHDTTGATKTYSKSGSHKPLILFLPLGRPVQIVLKFAKKNAKEEPCFRRGVIYYSSASPEGRHIASLSRALQLGFLG